MSNLAIEARPRTWDEVAGQKIAKNLLKKIASNPDTAPKVLMLYGPFGSSKTTQARIFAAEVSGTPYDELKTSPYLMEYDSSALNKEVAKNEIENWYNTPSGYRVIILDECHLLDKAHVQPLLLKVFEDMPPRTFIVMCTTDYDKVLDTIKSRCLEIKLELVSHDEAYNNIYQVCEKFNIDMDDEVAERIIQVGHGHMRTVHQNISKYELLGKEQYLSLFKSAYSAIERYLLCCAHKNKEEAFKAIDNILSFPLCSIKEDFDKVILDMLKAFATDGNQLSKAFSSNTLAVFKVTRADWFTSSFETDVELQAALLCLFQTLAGSSQSQQTQAQSSQSQPVVARRR